MLESVAEAAARLCRADGAVIFQRDGDVYRFAAGYSLVPAYLEIERQSIIAPGRGTVVGRAAITRQVIRIDDLLTRSHLRAKGGVEGRRLSLDDRRAADARWRARGRDRARPSPRSIRSATAKSNWRQRSPRRP